MKVFIKYKDNKEIIDILNYESIHSIIGKYIKKKNIDSIENINDYYINYNGICLDKNFSLEKYEIYNDSILELNKKLRGGSTNDTFSSKNSFFVFCVVLIVLIPIFLLPIGFIPLTASLLQNIINKSIMSIGNYLVCVLGKKTLFSRIRLFIVFLKYVFLILMVFVVITFPLILLCVTLKGKSILDNPQNLCSPISVGNQTGMILTMIYLLFYILFRGGNYVFETLIYICKKSYLLNMLLNPIFKFLLSSYNRVKYLGIFMIPGIGSGLMGYYTFLEVALVALEMMLSTVTSIGCGKVKEKGNKTSLINSMKSKLNDFQQKKSVKEEVDRLNNEIKVFESAESFCLPDKIVCCDPSNYISIADVFYGMLENPLASKGFRVVGMFPSFVLFTQALYESALARMGANNDLLAKSYNDRRLFLKQLLQEKTNEVPNDAKDLIKDFLNSNSDRNIDEETNLIYDIKKKLDKYFPANDDRINELKEKINIMEGEMIDYAREDGSSYTPGSSLFKTVFKIIFVDIFCNVVSTTKASSDVIHKMGDMKDIVDMLKAGSSSGVFIAIFYFITVIVLVICGMFGIF